MTPASVSSLLTCFLALVLAFSLYEAVDGANVSAAAAVKQSTTEVAKKLEEALKTAQDGLKFFYSDDSLTFVNSLLNTVGTVPPWFIALATAHRLIPLLFGPNPPNDQDLKVLTAAMKKIFLNNEQINQKYGAIEPGFPNQIVSSAFRDQKFSLFSIATEYSIYSEILSYSQGLVSTCNQDGGVWSVVQWIPSEIERGYSKIRSYFEDSCNYTEIVLRSRQVTGLYMRASQLYSFCFGVENSKYPESEFTSTLTYRARYLDEDWAKMAAIFHPVLMNIRQLKDCMPLFTDTVDFYSKRNKGAGHEEFAAELALHLYEKFPWINWYVFSYDDGLGGDDEHFCIDGILSHCIQRKYGRNLFVAGQQAEDNYFYNSNCPAVQDCIQKLDFYKNCEDATRPFEDCIREKCKPPAGTLCKKSSDGFAAEKGSSASSDGWSEASFGTENKYSMHVVSP